MAKIGRRNKSRKLFDTKLLIISGILMGSLFTIISLAQTPQDLRGRAQGLANCTVNNKLELEISPEEKTLVDMINAYRRQNGLTDFKISPTLTRAATWMSTDMNSTKKLEHIDSRGRSMAVRLAQCGYEGNTAENISNRFEINDVFNGWKGSPQHNGNILNARYSVIGLARVGTFWTMNFGSEDDSANQPPEIPDDTGNVPPINNNTAPSPSGVPSGNGVPNPNCLGACTTPEPSSMQPDPITTTPDISEAPIDNNTISGFPQSPTKEQNPDGDSTDNPSSGGGFVVLILEFFKKLLELLLALLGGGK